MHILFDYGVHDTALDMRAKQGHFEVCTVFWGKEWQGSLKGKSESSAHEELGSVNSGHNAKTYHPHFKRWPSSF